MNVLSDDILLERTSRGDHQAFGELVSRHQSLVCSVAYSIVGDIGRSEDVAQDAFLAAWKQIGRLRDRDNFKSWICSIARNLARTAVRRQRPTQPLEAAPPPVSAEPSPAENLQRHENESLVWQALAGLPETYREPLVLYYRNDHSVASVAEALTISPDAAKQRLSRGREMLREEMTAMIERTLRRTAPGKAFTLAVVASISGVSAASAGAATAGAATSAAGKSAAPLLASAMSVGALGALIGTIGGLLGAAVGFWGQAQSLPYPRQRAMLRKGLPVNFAIVFIFLMPILALSFGWWNPMALWGPKGYTLALILWQLTFFLSLCASLWVLNRRLRRIAGEEIAAGSPPDWTPMARRLSGYAGRRWTSQATLLGWPLVDINFSAPGDNPYFPYFDPLASGGATARGWIALGDRAFGLFAFGQFAAGGIAVGGVSVGLLASGGLGVGIVSLSGLSIGLFALGGLALGGMAVGGLAAGWLAIGGAAFAWRAAIGGFALAHDFAVGGSASAINANNDTARTYFEQSTAMKLSQSLIHALGSAAEHPWLCTVAFAGCALVLVVAVRFIAGQFKSMSDGARRS